MRESTAYFTHFKFCVFSFHLCSRYVATPLMVYCNIIPIALGLDILYN